MAEDQKIADYVARHRLSVEPDFVDEESARPISVVVPAFNEAEHIEQTVESIANSSEASGDLAEIVVVDNASADETASLVRGLKRARTPIRLLFNGDKGVAPTRKRGMDQVVVAHHQFGQPERSKYIMMTDGDTLVPEGWIDAIYQGFTRGKPNMVTGVYEYPPYVDETIFSETGLAQFFRRLSLLSYFLMEQAYSVVHTIGANSGIEVVSYADVDGINPNLPREEDYDLGIKTRLHGGKIALIPQAVQTSPRRALIAMLREVDFANTNGANEDLRGNDQTLLSLVLAKHSVDAWIDQEKLREGYIILGRIVLPALKGDLNLQPLREFLGPNHPFIMELNLLIAAKNRDEAASGKWDNEKTRAIAKAFAFQHGQSLIEMIDPLLKLNQPVF